MDKDMSKEKMTMEKSKTEEKVIVPKSGRCSWGKCIFCGYGREEHPVNIQVLKAWLDAQLLDFSGNRLKIYCSGSFLDDNQFPKEFRDYVVRKCKEKGIKELHIESRPEFVTDEKLEEFSGLDLTIGIGLEVADNQALEQINKGFTVEEFVSAANKIHDHGFKVKAYLLANLPIENARTLLKRSVEFAKKYADMIVVMNVLPHGKTPLLDMWMSGKWRPLDEEEFKEWTKDFEGDPRISLEFETFRFIPNIPNERKEFIEGVGVQFLDHPHYRIWQDWFCRFYKPPRGKEIALFVPCSYTKPYSRSKTHRAIDKAIRASGLANKVHKIVISSPGVIPFEFNDTYPFNAYEWDERKETPEIKEEYIKITRERIRNFLKRHARHYKYILAYFRLEAESLKALMEACNELGLECKLAYDPKTYKELINSGERRPLVNGRLLEELRRSISKLG